MSYRCAKPEAAICASAANAPFVRTADGQAFTSQGRLSEKAVLWPLYGKGLLRGQSRPLLMQLSLTQKTLACAARQSL
jgi:hypothetical protein